MQQTREGFHQELQEIHDMLLRMGSLVEGSIAAAVKALAEQNIPMAKQVIESDDLIDELEIEIEDKCLRLIALQQPMASDLRLIVTGLKIVTDLERIGDHAVDIGKITIRMQDYYLFTSLIDIPKMAVIAQEMLKDALDSYVERNPDKAKTMCLRDDEVDHIYAKLFDRLIDRANDEPELTEQIAYLLGVAQYLERVADHATNIGEWVIYLVTGERFVTNKCNEKVTMAGDQDE
jgi:phosphate transport system protein